MQEIAPGIFHWSAFHEGIRQDVHSYYVAPAAAMIDPMQPDEGLDWFAEHAPPGRALLTNRHHYRHCARFAERFGIEVLCHNSGLHEFDGGPDVLGFDWGDEVAPGITAHEVDAICPEEAALHVQHGGGALAVADGVVRPQGPDADLGFVPDFLLGDEADRVKQGLSAAYSRLADELEFECLLMAHGEPVVGGARDTLREFAARAA